MGNKMGRQTRFMGWAALAAVAVPSAGFAYGVEVPENGTVPFGRAGAYVARASDPSAVALNMAGVMGQEHPQIMLSVNAGASSNCFQRSGTYDGNADVSPNAAGTRFNTGADGLPGYAGRNYPEVCSDTALALAAQVLATYRLNRWVAFGAGLHTPSTPGAQQNFQDTTTLSGGILAPSPARNMLFQKNFLVLYPTIGVAVAPHPRLRFGLALQPSIASFQFGLMANAAFTNPQSPDTDLYIQLNAMGFFMAGAVSTQILATPWLSFGAQFHYNAPVTASGTANTIAGYYASPASGQAPGTFHIDEMHVQLPWNLNAGVRYNRPRRGQPTQDDGSGHYDPMRDDVFDFEVDFHYEATHLLGHTAIVNSGNINVGNGAGVPAPRNIVLDSNLSDTMGVRVGADWNIIPGVLAARLGFSYDTQGLNASSMVVHIPAYGGESVHAGLSYRWRWLTINAGVGQFFFQSVDASASTGYIVTPGDGTAANNQLTSCTASQGQGACTISRGTYHGSFTSGSLGFTFRL